MSFQVPAGIQCGGVHCGVKDDATKNDLMLIVAEANASGAGVYTQNVVHAASVGRNRTITPSDRIRAILANSGNANTCTGKRGEQDNKAMADATASALGIEPDQVLVMSTGIIGEFLPMEKIKAGIAAVADELGASEENLHAAAHGMMTTDQFEKIVGRRVNIAGNEIHITGFAKGAGMIGPNMATMLAVILTDAALAPEAAQSALSSAVDQSFNCISVEGHMSTSDSVLLLASGAAGAPLAGSELAAFQTELDDMCIELARMIPSDGEGASHLINIEVRGCKQREDARRIAQTVANSALVKTGVAGADPNWGRITSAAGYSGIAFDPNRLSLWVNEVKVYADGEPLPFDEPAMAASIRDQRETFITIELAEGEASCRFWTSDLTADYVRFNSESHT